MPTTSRHPLRSRYLRSLPRTPRANATWTTFLRNHRDGIAAMDFFTVPTAMFRVLHVFLVIRHGRRDVVRCAVTTSPTVAWVAQQLRETFPFESAPRFLIFDRDAIFSAGLTATIRSMLMGPTRTSYRSPWQNGVAERFVGTVRQELLDHVIVLNERHLRQLIESFVTYYNVDRTHIGVGKDSPSGRPVEQSPGLASNVVSLPRSTACITATPGARRRKPFRAGGSSGPCCRQRRRKGIVRLRAEGDVHSRARSREGRAVFHSRRPPSRRSAPDHAHGS